MTPVAPHSAERVHITRSPGVCGGKPCIAGSRIRVLDIYVWHELQGKSPDEIVSRYPQLTLSDVYAALAWIWDYREEVIADLAREHEVSEQMKQLYPSKLDSKLAGLNGTEIPP